MLPVVGKVAGRPLEFGSLGFGTLIASSPLFMHQRLHAGAKTGMNHLHALLVIKMFYVDHLVVNSHGSSSDFLPLVIEIKR